MTRIFLTPFAALALAAPTVLAGPIIAPVITLDLPELPPGKTLRRGLRQHRCSHPRHRPHHQLGSFGR